MKKQPFLLQRRSQGKDDLMLDSNIIIFKAVSAEFRAKYFILLVTGHE